jgi:hypothetical protein
MLFQTLDNKRECYAIYCDGELYHYPNNLQLSETWDWTCHAPRNVDAAQIWCRGKSLQEVCPDSLKPRLEQATRKGKAFLKAMKTSRVSLGDVCFYDFVPKNFLLDYCQIKNDITQHVFDTYQKPKNYNFLISLVEMLDDIAQRDVTYDHRNLSSLSALEHKRALEYSSAKNILYNPWGSVTGRLTTKSSSFPILTLPRVLRPGLKPTNDLFVELDYNSAEMRTAFSLSNLAQPSGDIHDYLKQEVFKDKYERDQVKQKVFAWLYNPKARNKKLQQFLNKDNILHEYYNGHSVETPFNRSIEVAEEKALNYLIQSTTSDLFLTQAIKVFNILSDSNSHIAFCIHDSLVIDMSRSDQHLMQEIMSLFSDTSFGHFKTNISIGKDYGNMRKIQ